MTVKGRKSFDTIIAEAQFKTAIKVLGGEYLYEKEIYKTQKNSYGVANCSACWLDWLRKEKISETTDL